MQMSVRCNEKADGWMDRECHVSSESTDCNRLLQQTTIKPMRHKLQTAITTATTIIRPLTHGPTNCKKTTVKKMKAMTCGNINVSARKLQCNGIFDDYDEQKFTTFKTPKFNKFQMVFEFSTWAFSVMENEHFSKTFKEVWPPYYNQSTRQMEI